MRLGALEAGGTKMVCSVGDEQGRIEKRAVISTGVPDETLPLIIAFFMQNNIAALGIGSFGPLDLNTASPAYGSITSTPKPGWNGYPLLKTLTGALRVPALIDTDVNAAALGEHIKGAGRGFQHILYVTVGTGIGGGIICGKEPVHGLLHPELGHMLLRPLPDDPLQDGVCPYHRGCLEGLASGPSLQARFGVPARELTEDHIAWTLETEYLAQMCVNATVMLSPERIILGGGVMQQPHLFTRIQDRTRQLLNGYILHERITTYPETYIVPPGLGGDSGVTGALLLAARAAGYHTV